MKTPKWIEKEENFPCLMVNKSGALTIAKNKELYILNTEYGFYLADKADLNKLHTKK